MNNWHWTKEEIEFLQLNYLIMTNKELSKHVKHTFKAVQYKLSHLKLNRPDKIYDIKIGDKFGKMIVTDNTILRVSQSNRNRPAIKCKCKCNRCDEEIVLIHDLTRLHVQQCQICHREAISINAKAFHTTHNKTKTKEYKLWISIKTRCRTSINYLNKNIIMEEPWASSFEIFYQWLQDNNYQIGKTIDRINNSKNYCESNCRLTDKYGQANNKSNNVNLTIFNETKTIAQWSRDSRCKVCEVTLRTRIGRGWDPEKAITIGYCKGSNKYNKIL